MTILQEVDTISKQQKTAPNVMFMNGSLKQNEQESYTYYLWTEVEKEFKKQGIVKFEHFHLAKMNIQPGVNRTMSTPDDMDKVFEGIKNNDIIVFGTPIWWGNPSSLIQRIIERLDDINTYRYKYEQDDMMLKKIFCMLVTGAEDGGQQCIARLNGWAPFLGFTIPPYNGLMWLGNKKSDVKQETVHPYVELLVQHAVRCANLLMSS